MRDSHWLIEGTFFAWLLYVRGKKLDWISEPDTMLSFRFSYMQFILSIIVQNGEWLRQVNENGEKRKYWESFNYEPFMYSYIGVYVYVASLLILYICTCLLPMYSV